MNPLKKLSQLAGGDLVICSDAELDAMAAFDVSNIIRSRPNPQQVGARDQWECWIEQRDLKRFQLNAEEARRTSP